MAASVAAPAALRAARATGAQFTLKLHHCFSSVSSPHERFVVPWARKVEADSGGRLRIDIFPSMQLGGAPGELFDQARDGAVDIVWALPETTPGRFLTIELFELPFVPARRAFVNSKAIQDFAAASLMDEFREVRPLCFSCRDRAILHSKRTIESVEHLRGLRLHVTNRFAAQAAHLLGAQGVAMQQAQVPMAIAKHVIDGCVDPWDVVPGLKLYGSLRSHTDFVESALSTTTLVLAMNKAAYERLPRDLKAVIDNNSGQPAASMAGAMWDFEAAAVAATARQRGGSVVTVMADSLAHWRKATGPAVEGWVKQMKERKADGQKLLAAARGLLAKYANEPEPPPPPQETPAQAQTVEASPQAQADVRVTPSQPSAAAPMPKPAPAPVRAPPKELDIPL